MKVFSTRLNNRAVRTADCHIPEELFEILAARKYQTYPYRVSDLGEQMATVERHILNYWKPLYLVDLSQRKAFCFMDTCGQLLTVQKEDIDWDSLKELPPMAVYRARQLNAQFPTSIGLYDQGRSLVSWQLNPDGDYYMDEEGFGKTDDVKIELYGMIDRQGKVVLKFSYDSVRHK